MTSIALNHVDVGTRKLKAFGTKMHEAGLSKRQKYKQHQTVIFQAFREYGFAYLSGHGIPDKVVSECMAASREFFALPQETKKLYRYGKDGPWQITQH